MEHEDLTPIPGVDGWSYGPFRDDIDGATRTVPLRSDDGASVEFTVPEFVSDPEDLRAVAQIVIGAIGKWERVKGLGA